MVGRNKIMSNLIWRFAERTGAQMVGFVIGIILARILDPSDYGIVSMITVFTAILQVFVDSGLGNALIQKKDADQVDFSTVFYTNIVFCLIIYTIVFCIAPLVERFYNMPGMCAMMRALGITVLIAGVKNIQQAYVSRHLMFKKFFFATLAGTIGAGVLGIFLAYHGFGAWALICQSLFNLIVDTIILWVTVRWRPIRAFSFERLKGLFSYGWKLLVSHLIDTGYNNLRSLIIGKVYSASDLAFYTKGRTYPNLVVTNINNSIDSVLFPAMAKEQDNRDTLRGLMRRAIKISVFLMAPAMMGLAAVAPTVVRLLLTEKWLPCVPFLRIFCTAYMFQPIHTSNLNAIKAMGRSDMVLKLEIIKKCIGFLTIIVCIKWGVLAMAYSLLVTNVISQIINSSPNKRLLQYGYLQQIRDILPSILLAAGMGLIIQLLPRLGLPVIPLLALQVAVGAVIYFAGAKLFKIDSLEYTISMAKSFFGGKRKKETA